MYQYENFIKSAKEILLVKNEDGSYTMKFDTEIRDKDNMRKAKFEFAKVFPHFEIDVNNSGEEYGSIIFVQEED